MSMFFSLSIDLCSDKIPNCDVCEVQNGVVVCTKCAAEYQLSADNAMCIKNGQF